MILFEELTTNHSLVIVDNILAMNNVLVSEGFQLEYFWMMIFYEVAYRR